MPDYLWTARLEAAAKARGVSLTSPKPWPATAPTAGFIACWGRPPRCPLHPFPPGGEVNENDSYYLLGRHLRAQGAPVPEIYTYCREGVLDDHGGPGGHQPGVRHQAAVPGRARSATGTARPYVLVDMQIKGQEGFDSSWCFDTPVLHRPFLWERECGYSSGPS